MQHGHRHREAPVEPVHELRREPDLRHQHEGAAAEPQGALDHPQIDLRLAAAGDAVQHEAGEGAQRLADSRDGEALLVVRLGAGSHRNRRRGWRGAARRSALDACLSQPRAMSARAASRQRSQLLVELGGRQPGPRRARIRAAAFRQRSQELPLARSPPRLPCGVRFPACRRESPALLGRIHCGAQSQSLRQGGGEHLADRMVVVVRRPAEQREGGGVEDRLRDPALSSTVFSRSSGSSELAAVSMATPMRRRWPNGTRTRVPATIAQWPAGPAR